MHPYTHTRALPSARERRGRRLEAAGEWRVLCTRGRGRKQEWARTSNCVRAVLALIRALDKSASLIDDAPVFDGDTKGEGEEEDGEADAAATMAGLEKRAEQGEGGTDAGVDRKWDAEESGQREGGLGCGVACGVRRGSAELPSYLGFAGRKRRSGLSEK